MPSKAHHISNKGVLPDRLTPQSRKELRFYYALAGINNGHLQLDDHVRQIKAETNYRSDRHIKQMICILIGKGWIGINQNAIWTRAINNTNLLQDFEAELRGLVNSMNYNASQERRTIGTGNNGRTAIREANRMAGMVGLRTIARNTSVSHVTISNWIKEAGIKRYASDKKRRPYWKPCNWYEFKRHKIKPEKTTIAPFYMNDNW